MAGATPKMVEIEAPDNEIERLAARLQEAGFSLSYTETGIVVASRGLMVRGSRLTAKGHP